MTLITAIYYIFICRIKCLQLLEVRFKEVLEVFQSQFFVHLGRDAQQSDGLLDPIFKLKFSLLFENPLNSFHVFLNICVQVAIWNWGNFN